MRWDIAYLRVVFILEFACRARYARITGPIVIHTTTLVELLMVLAVYHCQKDGMLTLALGAVFGSARIKLAAFSEAVTMRAEGLVLGSPGKILASTTKMLSVP